MEESETQLDDEDLTKAEGMAAFVNQTKFPAVMPALNLEESKTLIKEYLKKLPNRRSKFCCGL